MEVRDPIYGFIEFSEIEKQIIDTPVFQRLRHVKQLALANYVYPGANHTRFEHSLGVMHVASKMAEHLGLSKDTIKIVRLAGLLHDIGHGPFGHVSEEVFKAIGTRQQVETGTYKFHELITVRAIKSDQLLAPILNDQAEVIAEIANPYGKPSIEKEIVSSPLDADKMDYLLRDSYFCGVKYGVFDQDRLIIMLEPFKRSNILVRYEGIQCFEQFVLAKYFINTQVYRHRIRLITDAMIKRAILLSLDSNVYIKELYAFEDSDEYLEKYLKSHDSEVIRMGSIGDSNGAKIFQLLQQRDLFKMVFQSRASNDVIKSSYVSMGILEQAKNPDRKKFSKVEERIADIFQVNPDFTIANIYRIELLAKEAGGLGKVNIIRDGPPEDVLNYSTICNRIGKEFDLVFIEIYIPLSLTPEERKKLCKEKKQEIIECLEEFSTS